MENEEEDGGPQLADLVFSITTNGRRYDINMGDFSAQDEMEFRQATQGYDLMDVFAAGKINATTVAAMVWLVRRRYGESKLTFEKVARRFKYSDLATVSMSDGTEDGEVEAGSPPES